MRFGLPLVACNSVVLHAKTFRRKQMNPSNPSLMERFENYKPSKSALLWACVLSVAATMIVGFSWGGWTTGGTAAEMARKAADSASASLAAAVCVVQFDSDPGHAVQLASLNKVERWDRAGFVTKGGWATLPGMKEPISGAADLCAQQLTTAPLPLASAADNSK
jgi:hypothetical protein